MCHQRPLLCSRGIQHKCEPHVPVRRDFLRTRPPGGWTQPTIFDHLDLAGVSWRYYYQDSGAYLPQWSTYQRDAAKLAPIANWAGDLQNEACLPSVIFIERAAPSGLDEHPGNNIQLRAADVANILNELAGEPVYILEPPPGVHRVSVQGTDSSQQKLRTSAVFLETQ